jgi:BlaI family transcriptional regulator, penicillinase repressor
MPELARRERQIMDLIYAAQAGGATGGGKGVTAADIHQSLPDPPSYSAVRALLRILEDKGHLRHKRIGGGGRQYLYFATTPRTQAAKSALRRVLDTFFAGSIEQALVTHLADPRAKISADEAHRLTQLIHEARQRGE